MKRITQIAVAAVTFTFALALAAPTEAQGRHDRRHRVDQRHHRHHEQHRRFDHHDRHLERQDRLYRHDRRHERHYRYDRFDIPRRIHDHRRHEFRSYFEGTVYFAPHRHRHPVYRFPVRVGRGWAYREHFYCGDELFLDFGRFEYHGRRFSISIGH